MMTAFMTRLLSHLILCLAALSCSLDQGRSETKDRSDYFGGGQWDKQRWISRASKSLRNNKIISRAELSLLNDKSKEEIVQYLLSDPAFADTMLDFNLYFLGFKNVANPRDFPQAIKSAQEAFAGTDFDRILSFEGPLYPAVIETDVEYGSTEWDQVKLQDKAETKNLLNIAKNGSFDSLCEAAGELQSAEPKAIKLGTILGLSSDTLQSACFTGNFNDLETIVAELEKKLQSIDKRYEKARDFLARNIRFDGSVMSYKELPAIGPWQGKRGKFGRSFWRHLTNSSTNYNRKRSAYILDRYFCDDLTPLNVSNPGSHSEEAHASSPACQACHYKLDPMAGFFRDLGVSGVSFADSEHLIFDDEATVSGSAKEEYLASWKSANGKRKWNVGYIQSASSERYNRYGESLSDLENIIKTSKQSQVCLTKRIAHYFLGEEQSFDGAWIESLAEQFTQAANSSVAVKNIVTSLILSNTFAVTNGDPKICYDFSSSSQNTGVPCQVASLISRNCASCHGDSFAAGGLNLNQWVGSSFQHVKAGVQQTPVDTFNEMINRINSTDPSYRMPLGAHMSPSDRAALYHWLLEQIGEHNER